MTSRIIITKPMNFMATLILVNLVMLLIGIAGTLVYVGVSGKYVTEAKHEEIISMMEKEIDGLEKHQVTNAANYQAEVSKLQKEVLLREQEIGTLNVHINEMDEYADFIMSNYYYVFDQIDENNVKNPIKYSNLVTLDKIAREKDVNPHLVLGLFNLESGFNTKAKSHISTATGLGQFLGSTGAWVYDKFLDYEDDYIHSKMATDADINIELTINYLDYLLDTYDGDVKQSLIAYNGNELGAKYYGIIDNYMVAKTSRGLNYGSRYVNNTQ